MTQLALAPDAFLSTHDRAVVMRLVEPFARGDRMDILVIDGEPPSKARPRFTAKGKPYTPSATVAGEKRLAAHLATVKTYRGNVAVGCVFHRSTRQRIDIDNLLKAVLDASTRARVWEDDSQVTALAATIEHDPDRPRIVICFAPHVCSLTRGEDAMVRCEACGTLFFPSGQRREQARWCSRECRTRLAAPVPCPACGKFFRRRNGNHKFCSNACRGVGRTAAAAETRALTRTCKHGHELSAENVYVLPNGGQRCRRCQADAARAYRRSGRNV